MGVAKKNCMIPIPAGNTYNKKEVDSISTQKKPSPEQAKKELAEQLWADSNSRESMLLAPMLYPVDQLTPQRAAAMAREVRWSEDADILCHRLLRHTPFVVDLASDLVSDTNRLTRYTGLRLLLNLLNQPSIINHPTPTSTPLFAAATAALTQEQQRPDPLTSLLTLLQDQLTFLSEK